MAQAVGGNSATRLALGGGPASPPSAVRGRPKARPCARLAMCAMRASCHLPPAPHCIVRRGRQQQAPGPIERLPPADSVRHPAVDAATLRPADTEVQAATDRLRNSGCRVARARSEGSQWRHLVGGPQRAEDRPGPRPLRAPRWRRSVAQETRRCESLAQAGPTGDAASAVDRMPA